MTPRMSTSMMFNQSVSTMLSGQVRLSHLNQQLSTGQRLITAKDDPVAAGAAVELQRTLAALQQYEKNANLAQSRLNMQENVLEQAGHLIGRVKELMIKATDGILALEDRQAIAGELSKIRESLIGLANASDGNQRHLFAGTADASAPFVNEDGRIVYRGDQVQRRIDIAPNTSVMDTLPGSEVFMRIRTGDGIVDARAHPRNTGTGLLLDFSRTGNANDFDGGQYRVQFDQEQRYRVLDVHGNVIAEGQHASGEDITFAAVRLRIDGHPAAGDSFEIGPATSKDVFSSLDEVINALNTPAVSAADTAALNNLLHAGLRNLGYTSEHFIRMRTACGAQLAQMDTAADWRAANQVNLKTDISAIEGLDYLAAIGQYEMERIVLQAAHSVFLKMQGMSLFNAVR